MVCALLLHKPYVAKLKKSTYGKEWCLQKDPRLTLNAKPKVIYVTRAESEVLRVGGDVSNE